MKTKSIKRIFAVVILATMGCGFPVNDGDTPVEKIRQESAITSPGSALDITHSAPTGD